jgi:hypothetical protein
MHNVSVVFIICIFCYTAKDVFHLLKFISKSSTQFCLIWRLYGVKVRRCFFFFTRGFQSKVATTQNFRMYIGGCGYIGASDDELRLLDRHWLAVVVV